LKIINSILSNRCTLIGYDSRSESVVDRITDSIPNKIVYTEPYSENGVSTFFTSNEIIRDLKINSIISNIRKVCVIINLTYLKTSSESASFYPYELKNMLRELNSHLYNISNDCPPPCACAFANVAATEVTAKGLNTQ
jgi:glutathionyl-hydroquinone reductase